MYEENCHDLPPGDFATVFAASLEEIAERWSTASPTRIKPDNVVQWGEPDIRAHFTAACRRLLLPGSGLLGAEHLVHLSKLAAGGESCMLCLNHQSNLDVPTLHVLLEDQGLSEHAQRLIWLAGRKLHEDVGPTRLLVQAFHHLVVSPRSWMKDDHTDDERREARRINAAAHRAIRRLRGEGWIFGLFPTGTRERPHDATTRVAIPETDSYLKSFRYLLLGHIDGCTLPVSRDRDMTHETPRLDRVRFVFAPVAQTSVWRVQAARRFPHLDQRQATALAIIEDIAALAAE